MKQDWISDDYLDFLKDIKKAHSYIGMSIVNTDTSLLVISISVAESIALDSPINRHLWRCFRPTLKDKDSIECRNIFAHLLVTLEQCTHPLSSTGWDGYTRNEHIEHCRDLIKAIELAKKKILQMSPNVPITKELLTKYHSLDDRKPSCIEYSMFNAAYNSLSERPLYSESDLKGLNNILNGANTYLGQLTHKYPGSPKLAKLSPAKTDRPENARLATELSIWSEQHFGCVKAKLIAALCHSVNIEVTEDYIKNRYRQYKREQKTFSLQAFLP